MAWALVFAFITPSTYQGVISQVIVHIWSLCVGAGALVALIGMLTRRDLKVELPGLYLIGVGGLIYLVAQVGFSGHELRDRLALLTFIGWHLSLLLPRFVGLTALSRRIRRNVLEDGRHS